MTKRPTWLRSLLLLCVGLVALLVLRRLGHENPRAERSPQSAPPEVGGKRVTPTRKFASEDEGRRAGERASALFVYGHPPDAASLSAAMPAPARDIHYVRQDATLLTGKRSPFWQLPGVGRVEMPLPAGGQLTVVIANSEMTGPDQFTSNGTIEGRPGSRVVFGYSGGFLHASIEDARLGAFALRPVTETWSQFYQVDSASILPCGGPRPLDRPMPRAASGQTAVRGLAPEVPLAAADNPQHAVIHVLMVHTTAVLPTMTGPARTQALQSGFLAVIEKVNVTFQASQITARVKLVRVHETRLVGDEVPAAIGNWQHNALDALIATDDGAMDEVHAVRDAAGADVVCLAVHRPDFASSGLSYVLNDPTRFDNAEYALSVVQYGSIAATNVVAHELGHLFGCAHDRANATHDGAFPYSFGYRFVGANGVWYHDIMGYSRLPGTFTPEALELGYFSNPRILIPPPVNAPIGIPAGSPGESDTARTIEQTAFSTANYRLQTETPVASGVLLNVATRAFVGRDEQVLIGGFVVNGTRPKRLLVRAAGPALRTFGVADALTDPVLRVFGGGTALAENDNWSGSDTTTAAAQVAAFPFPVASKDSALIVALPPGAYTPVVEGNANATGTGLMEVYDLEAGPANRVMNLATRGYADNVGREMVGGFVVQGAPGETKRVLVRVLGPSLARAPFSLSGVLNDPMFQLRNAAGELLIESDDWSSDAEGGPNAENDFRPVVTTFHERAIFATGHAPSNRREPCVLVDLPPGSYTVIVKPFEFRSAEASQDQPAQPGVGIIEVYEIGR